jgi:hypothetical protein
MLVQGTGFNWDASRITFRIVFLPHEDDLREAIGRIAQVPRASTANATKTIPPPVRPDQAGGSHRA